MVLNMEEWAQVWHLHRQGLSKRAIAKRTGIARDTVRKYLSAPTPTPPNYTPRGGRHPSVEPYAEYLQGRLAEFPELTAQRLYEEVRERGFPGSYPVIVRFVRPLRKPKELEAVYRFETPPGHQAQVDWAKFGTIEVDGERKPLWAFIMVLGFSRARYVEFTTDVTTPTFIACHLHAFEYFGGRTKEILYDNTKNVVIDRAILAADSRFNQLFLNFTAYYGLVTRLARPYRAQTKGKVESSVRFVRGGFFVGRHFSSLSELNRGAREWCNAVNQRVHGTTHVPPIDRLEEEHLLPVTDQPPFPIIQEFPRQIQRDGVVNFQGNKYSVPWNYSGRKAVIRLEGASFTVLVDGQEVWKHRLSPGTGHEIRIEGHRAGLLEAIRKRNNVVQSRLGHYPSLPPAPEVEQRDLGVYDQLLEEKEEK